MTHLSETRWSAPLPNLPAAHEWDHCAREQWHPGDLVRAVRDEKGIKYHVMKTELMVGYACDGADTDRVCIDDLAYGDVDNRLGHGDQVRVLIHVKPVLQRWDVTSCHEETSEVKGIKGIYI